MRTPARRKPGCRNAQNSPGREAHESDLKRLRTRSRRIVKGLLVLIAAAAVAAGLFAWGSIPASALQTCSLVNNAAWLSVDWTSRSFSDEQISSLAVQARQRKLAYLYPFTTYLQQDGTFSAPESQSADFVKKYKQINPDTRLLAWIGVPLLNSHSYGVQGWVDLTQPAIRRQITAYAARLVKDTGFDGIHIDVETIWNDDQAFLTLLDEMRAAIGPGALLSLATPHWMPPPLDRLPWVSTLRWSGAYYRDVALRSDQLVLMGYDSWVPVEALYRLWLREQVRGIDLALRGTPAQFIVGISVSREISRSHIARVETLAAGLAGTCAAISDKASQVGQPAGVALYASWAAADADWQLWDAWVGK